MVTERLELDVALRTQQLQRDAREVLRTARALDRAFAGISPRSVSLVERELRRSKTTVDRLAGSVRNADSNLTGLGRTAQLTARRFIVYNIIAGFFFRLAGAIREGVSAFVAFDAELNKARQILNPLNTDFEQFVSSIFELGEAFGVSIAEIQSAQETFIRQGKSQADTLELTRQALALAAAAGVDYAEATEAITAAVNQFTQEQLTAVEVADKFTAVSIRNAVTATDLDQAIRRAGAAAATVGVEFDNLVGFITAAQEATRRGGTVIGTGLRTIFTRIFRAPAIEALQELGIETRKATGEFRNADAIIADLAARFEDLNQTQRIAVASTIAGQRQIATLLAVLSNFESAQRAATDAQTSSGEAARLVRIRQESLEAQLQKVTNQFLRFGAAIGEAISDDVIAFLKTFADAFGFLGEAITGADGLGIGPLIGTLGKLGAILALQTVGVGKIGQSFRTAREEAKDARVAVQEFNAAQGRTQSRFSRARELFTGTDPQLLLKAREKQVVDQQAQVEAVIVQQKELQLQREREIVTQKDATARLTAEEKALNDINNSILKDVQAIRKAEVEIIRERNKLDQQGTRIKRSEDNLKVLEAERKEIEKAVAAAQGRLAEVVGTRGAGRGTAGGRGIQLERDRINLAKELLRNQEKIERIDSRIARSREAASAGRQREVLTETQLARATQARERLRGQNARVLRDLRADASNEEIKAARAVGSAELKQLRNTQAVAREKKKLTDLDKGRENIANNVAAAESRVAQITAQIATKEQDIAFIKSEIVRLEQLRSSSAANNEQLAVRELALTKQLAGEEKKLLDLENKRVAAQEQASGRLIRGGALRRGIGAFGISAIFQVATESLEIFGDEADKQTQRVKGFVQDIGGALSTAFLLGGPLGIVLGGVQAIFAVVKLIRGQAFEWKDATEAIEDLQSKINNSLRASKGLFESILSLSQKVQLEGLSSANFAELTTRLNELKDTFEGLTDAQLASFRDRLTRAVERNDIEEFARLRKEIERLNIIEGIKLGGDFFDRESFERGLASVIDTRNEIQDLERLIESARRTAADPGLGDQLLNGLLGTPGERVKILEGDLRGLRAELEKNVAALQGQGPALVQLFTQVIDPVRTLRQNLQEGLLENFIEEAGVLGIAAERFLEVKASATIAATAIEELDNRSKTQVDTTRALVERLRQEEDGIRGVINALAENELTQNKLTQSVVEFTDNIPEDQLRALSRQFATITQQQPDAVFRDLNNVINEGNGNIRVLRDETGALFIAVDGLNGVIPQGTQAFEDLFAIIERGATFTDLAITGFNKLGVDIISNARITEILARSYEALTSRLNRTTEALSETRRSLSSVAAANATIAQSFPTRALQSNRDILADLAITALDVDESILASIDTFNALEKVAQDNAITFGTRLQEALTQGGKAADLINIQLDVARESLERFRDTGERTAEVFRTANFGGGEGFESVRTGAVRLVEELIAVQELGAAVLGLDALKQKLLRDTGEVLAEDVDLIIQFREVLSRGFNIGPTEFAGEDLIDSRALGQQIADLLNSLGANIIRDSESPFAAAGQRLATALIESTNREISTGGDAIAKRFDTILTELAIVVAERLQEPIQNLREALAAVRQESDESLGFVVESVGKGLDSLGSIIQRGVVPPEQTLSEFLVGDFNVAIVAAEELVSRATDEVDKFNARLEPQIELRDEIRKLSELDADQAALLKSLEEEINAEREKGAELESKKREALANQNALLSRFNQVLQAGLQRLGQNFQEVIRTQAAVATAETKLFQLRLGFIDEETSLFTERTAQLALEREQVAQIRRSIAGLADEVDVQAVGQQIEQLTAEAATAAFSDTAQAQAIENRIANLNNQLSLEKTISEARLGSLQKELELINKQSDAITSLGVNFVKASDEQQRELLQAARLTEQFFGGLRPQAFDSGQVTGSIQNFLRNANEQTRSLVIGQLERLKAAGGEIAPGVGAAEILRQIGDAVGGAILRNPEIELAERQKQLQEEIVAEQKRLIEIAAVQLRVQTAQLNATQGLVNSLTVKAVAGDVTGGETLAEVQRNATATEAATRAADSLIRKEEERARVLAEETAEAGRAAVSNKRFVDSFRGVELSAGDAGITVEEFRSQLVELRDALITAEDAVIEARDGVTEAFNGVADALRASTVAQSQYILGLRAAEAENIRAVGGFQTFTDELNFLADAFQTQIRTLEQVGAAETEVARLRADLAQQQLNIFQQQIQRVEANAERLLTSASGRDFFEASRAGEIVGQLVRSIGIDPSRGATATQQSQLADAVLSLPLELRQSLADSFRLAPPGTTFAGFSPEELRQLVLSSVGGQGPATPDLLTLQQRAAEQRNIIAENQIQQLEQTRIGVNTALDRLRVAQEELLAAEAQRDLAQLQLDALQLELPRQTSLLQEVADQLRSGVATLESFNSFVRTPVGTASQLLNAAGGTLTPAEVGGLVRAASREKRAMPSGAQLGVFNTSETVLTNRQARMLRKTSRIPNAVDGFGNVSTDNQAIIAGLNAISNKLDRVVRDDGTRTVNLQLDSARRIRVDGAAGLDTALQDIFSERSAEMFSREEGDAIRSFILGLVQRLRVNGLNLPPDVERGL